MNILSFTTPSRLVNATLAVLSTGLVGCIQFQTLPSLPSFTQIHSLSGTSTAQIESTGTITLSRPGSGTGLEKVKITYTYSGGHGGSDTEVAENGAKPRATITVLICAKVLGEHGISIRPIGNSGSTTVPPNGVQHFEMNFPIEANDDIKLVDPSDNDPSWSISPEIGFDMPYVTWSYFPNKYEIYWHFDSRSAGIALRFD